MHLAVGLACYCCTHCDFVSKYQLLLLVWLGLRSISFLFTFHSVLSYAFEGIGINESIRYNTIQYNHVGLAFRIEPTVHYITLYGMEWDAIRLGCDWDNVSRPQRGRSIELD